MSDKENKPKISTDPYKGVRDFYPEDMAIQNYIFNVWKKTAESFGYSEYGASILEPTELYKAKSGDELVNEQTYSFKDRGDRDVTLRPEMTPTVARMIAAKRKELRFPLRWYSIPNLFRYERPQRGRTREHFQLNCDIFGIEGLEADVEIISLAYEIMKSFKIKKENFQIRINYAGLLNSIFEDKLKVTKEESLKLIKIIDKKGKIDSKILDQMVIDLIGLEKTEKLNEMLRNPEMASKWMASDERFKRCQEVKKQLNLDNSIFDSWLTRGFDYYTGIIFEIYDTSKENPRALFGGGRYDNLLDIFGVEKVPAIGFGMGDVTIRDVLETYGLLPAISSPTKLYLCPMSEKETKYAQNLAQKIRASGINVAVDYSGKKVGDQIKYADKNKIPFVAIIGEEEVKTGKFKIKELTTGTETEVTEKTIAEFLK